MEYRLQRTRKRAGAVVMSVHIEARLSQSGLFRHLAARLGLLAAIGVIIVATLVWFGVLAWAGFWLISALWHLI